MSPWIAAARPKTLVAGAMPVILASAFAYQQDTFRLGVFVCALMSAIAIQVGTNYVNDAADFERGADKEDRLGPPRMAASGLLTPAALYSGAAICFLVALLFGFYLIWLADLWILVIGLFSIFFAIVYTAGPFPLAYLGLGDVFVLIFFGLIAVLGTVYAHALHIDSKAIWLALAAGFQGMSLIAVNNLRDIPTDVRAGKRTLAVRLGEKNSRTYVATLTFLPFFCWAPFLIAKPTLVATLPLLALPLAFSSASHCMRISNRREFNSLLARLAALQLIFGLLTSIALVLSW